MTNADRITAPDNQYHAEISRLKTALTAARLQSANRLAAIRAALAAAGDGESDPLAYLRDQLAEESPTPSDGSGL